MSDTMAIVTTDEVLAAQLCHNKDIEINILIDEFISSWSVKHWRQDRGYNGCSYEIKLERLVPL